MPGTVQHVQSSRLPHELGAIITFFFIKVETQVQRDYSPRFPRQSDSEPTLGTTIHVHLHGLKCCQSLFSLCDSCVLGSILLFLISFPYGFRDLAPTF